MVQQEDQFQPRPNQLLVMFSFSNSFTAGDANNGTGTNSTAYTAGSAGDYSGGGSLGTIDNHTLTITGTSQGVVLV